MRRKKTVITGRAQAARTPKRLLHRAPPPRPRGPATAPPGTSTPLLERAQPADRTGRGQAPSQPRREPLGPDVPVDLSVDLAPTRPGALVLRTPVLAAAGAFGYGLEYVGIVDFDELGAICTRGTTLKPRSGNPPPRMTETPAGLLNAIGLQNPGIDAVLERYAARWAGWPVPVIVNVGAESAEDFVALARKLDGQPGVAAIELNLSCPNSARGGLQFALDPAAAGQITAAVRRATDLPLLVKLSPAALDVREIARAVEDAGADAITAVNTLPGLAMDRQMRAPLLRGAYGGLSGPALKPVALRVVYEVAQAVDIPIVAAGGVGSLEDVLDFLFAGACAVQVGTALFADSGLPVQLVDDLDGYCRELGHGTHRELVGVAQPSGRARSSVKSGEYRA